MIDQNNIKNPAKLKAIL